MYITNIWGIFFCFVLPVIISMFLIYFEGVEEGRKEYARINRKK